MRARFLLLAAALFVVAVMGPTVASAHQSDLTGRLAAGLSTPTVTQAAAFDVSPAVRDLHPMARASVAAATFDSLEPNEARSTTDDLPISGDYTGDSAVQASQGSGARLSALSSFEGLANVDNARFLGHGWLPPDPAGAIGLNNYVEEINTVFAVYDRQGNKQFGPFLLSTLWQGFAIQACADNQGDPVVLFDKHADRFIMTQFTNGNQTPIYNCVAVSQTSDPTGAYFRYAFFWGSFFPDYPKYSVWKHAYLLTTRDFGPTTEYGISAAALERSKMIKGDPSARMVKFFLDSAVVPIYLMGDGLLPADIDGPRLPGNDAAPIVGTMNKGAQYGAPFDALNIFELSVDWHGPEASTFSLVAQLPVAKFTSRFPCDGGVGSSRTRSCIPQPGTTRKVDVLSYRQRPTFRLAFRSFGQYDAMVTNQSVQASPGMAGVRWYEIRRSHGSYSVAQQATYGPADGVHRWMGSIAMDASGNVGLGYSVSNATDVFPGIRFTGRLRGDPAGQMTLGEGVIMNGTGVQRHVASRWGDYTALNVDPVDDCTFWYVNQYMQNTAISTAPWQTRIGTFRLPGCVSGSD